MKLIVKKRFFEDLDVIKSREIIDEIDFLLDLVNACTDEKEIPAFKYLRQYPAYGRIAIPPYRIGVEVNGDSIIFHCILLREKIYEQFP